MLEDRANHPVLSCHDAAGEWVWHFLLKTLPVFCCSSGANYLSPSLKCCIICSPLSETQGCSLWPLELLIGRYTVEFPPKKYWTCSTQFCGRQAVWDARSSLDPGSGTRKSRSTRRRGNCILEKKTPKKLASGWSSLHNDLPAHTYIYPQLFAVLHLVRLNFFASH